MSTQYNLVADQYDLSFQLVPYRLYIEAYSVFELIGEATHLDVLELATGTGFYARALRQRGAVRVVAVDIAEQMVQIAQAAEQQSPLGIAYHVEDVTSFKSDTPFDLALGVYLLHYAPTREALFAMCEAVAANLKPGGRFITYVLNPALSREPGYYEREPGMVLKVPQGEPADGEVVAFTAKIGDMTMPEVMAYRWDKTTLEAALHAARFHRIRWVQPQLSPRDAERYSGEAVNKYLQQPHAVLLECIKP